MTDHNISKELSEVSFVTTTPFSPDAGSVDVDSLASNLSYIQDHGGRTFVACGNTGEYFSLTDDERVTVVGTHIETLGDDCTVLGGVGGSTAHAIELAQRYQNVGIDGILIMPPTHAYAHEKGLLTHYEQIASTCSVGVVVYARGEMLPDTLLADITEIENVIAVKYAKNAINNFSALVANTTEEVVWINGLAEQFSLSFALEGAKGYTTGLGNVAPDVTLRLFNALERQEWDRARAIRDALLPFEVLRAETGADNRLENANNVPAVKHAMDHVGLTGGPVRAPLFALSERDQQRAEDCIDSLLSISS